MEASKAQGPWEDEVPTTKERAVPRTQPEEPLEGKVLAIHRARIIDISSRGAQIEVAYSLPPLGRFDLRIQFADGEFAAHGIVRHCNATALGVDANDQPVVLYRAGLEFDELDPESLARLSANVLFRSKR